MAYQPPAEKIRTYREFWPFYLHEHTKPGTRYLHYFGTSLGIALAVVAVATQIWWLLAVALVSGYFFAWTSHFFVERNRPATFTYPGWSFISDFRMLLTWLAGGLKKEYLKHEIWDGTGDKPA
jgi:hypothetical protein